MTTLTITAITSEVAGFTTDFALHNQNDRAAHPTPHIIAAYDSRWKRWLDVSGQFV